MLSLALFFSALTAGSVFASVNPILTEPHQLLPGVTERDLVRATSHTDLLRTPMGEPVTAVTRNAQDSAEVIVHLIGLDDMDQALSHPIEILPLERRAPWTVTLRTLWQTVESGELRMQVALMRLFLLHEVWRDHPEQRAGLETLAKSESDAYLEAARAVGPYIEYYIQIKARLEEENASSKRETLWDRNADKLLGQMGVFDQFTRDAMGRADDPFFAGLENLGLSAVLGAGIDEISAQRWSDEARRDPQILSLEALRARRQDTAVSHYYAQHKFRFQIKDGFFRLLTTAPIQYPLYRLSQTDNFLGRAVKSSSIAGKITQAQRDADLTYEYGREVTRLAKNRAQQRIAARVDELLQLRFKGVPQDKQDYAVLEYLSRREDLRSFWDEVVAEIERRPEDKYLQKKVAAFEKQTHEPSFKGLSPFYRPSPARTLLDWGVIVAGGTAFSPDVVHKAAEILHTTPGTVAAGMSAAIAAVPAAEAGYRWGKGYLARRAAKAKRLKAKSARDAVPKPAL